MVQTLGKEAVAQQELLRLVAQGNIAITPQVMVIGGEGGFGMTDALMGTIRRQSVDKENK